MVGRPTTAKHRQREMLEWLIEGLGTDIFTTHELWDFGIDRTFDPKPWPMYLKVAFNRLRRREDLAIALRRHPKIKKLEDFDEMKGGLRTRSILWECEA